MRTLARHDVKYAAWRTVHVLCTTSFTRRDDGRVHWQRNSDFSRESICETGMSDPSCSHTAIDANGFNFSCPNRVSPVAELAGAKLLNQCERLPAAQLRKCPYICLVCGSCGPEIFHKRCAHSCFCLGRAAGHGAIAMHATPAQLIGFSRTPSPG